MAAPLGSPMSSARLKLYATSEEVSAFDVQFRSSQWQYDANADGITARRAVLRGANLFYTSLVQADLSGADLTDAFVYGVSAWDVQLKGAAQDRLVITTADEPTVVVDDLQVAQFLHLIISNRRIRGVIDALTTKVVLILGRFTPPRKIVLDCVRDGLRRRGFVPVLFDFDRPANRDFTETVVTLASRHASPRA